MLKLVGQLEPGEAIEVGCGAGAFQYDLVKQGFSTKAVEFSTEARRHARLFGSTVAENFDQIDKNLVDLVVALDVLEHIEDDVAALEQWISLLKPGGHMLLAVPCHMSKWGSSDEWAGHYRRYEKDGLIDLIEGRKLEVIHFESYGFPIANMTSWLRNRIHSDKSFDPQNEENSKRSGVERKSESRLFPILASPIGIGILQLGYLIQSAFTRTELGDGYIVLAKKAN